MDNQKDQSATTPDQNNASRPTNANNPTPAPTASASPTDTSRSKSASAAVAGANPTTQSTDATPNAQSKTSADAGADRQGEGQQTNAQDGTLLDTALNSGKKWIEDSGVLDGVNQLPQSLKDLGNRALDRVNGLTTTQKVVGGALIAAGLGWLATRKGKSSSSDSSSAYNYGRQRDAGSYGRKTSGYQAPDASTSRSDSGSAYGNSGSRFGSSGSYNTEASAASNTGIKSGSGRDDSGAAYGGASARTDHGTQSAKNDHQAKNNDYRSVE